MGGRIGSLNRQKPFVDARRMSESVERRHLTFVTPSASSIGTDVHLHGGRVVRVL